MPDETIMILGKPYTIRYLPKNQFPEYMGTVNRGLQIICVEESLAPQQREDTILHEVIHIIDGELAIKLSEEDIQRLSVGIHSAGYVRRPS